MGDQSFSRLCIDGDIEGVQAAIDIGADVNEENHWGATGLMWALHNGHNNVVQLLLHHPQININKVDPEDGYSSLHWAVIGDNHEGLAALLAQNDDLTSINQKDNVGWTPIMGAVAYNKVNCFHLLLTNPLVDLDTRDGYQRAPQEVREMVADHQEPTFEVIEELLMDKTIKFSMLAGQAPVLDRVKEELTLYWEREAKKGRSIEEFARAHGHPEMADLVIDERGRRTAEAEGLPDLAHLVLD